MPKRKPLTAGCWDAVREMASQGYSPGSISVRLNITKPSVRDILEGVTPRPAPEPPLPKKPPAAERQTPAPKRTESKSIPPSEDDRWGQVGDHRDRAICPKHAALYPLCSPKWYRACDDAFRHALADAARQIAMERERPAPHASPAIAARPAKKAATSEPAARPEPVKGGLLDLMGIN